MWQSAQPPSEPPPLEGYGVPFETIPPARLRHASPRGRKLAPKAKGDIFAKRGGEQMGTASQRMGAASKAKHTDVDVDFLQMSRVIPASIARQAWRGTFSALPAACG